LYVLLIGIIFCDGEGEREEQEEEEEEEEEKERVIPFHGK